MWVASAQKLADEGKLELLQEMYQEWPFMQVRPLHRTAVTMGWLSTTEQLFADL